MSYTPEQVEEVSTALHRAAYSNGARTAEAVEMLDAYAATLRQQSEAKAGVTDEVLCAAGTAFADVYEASFSMDTGTWNDNAGAAIRAALEAVWPQAALAQSTHNAAEAATRFVASLPVPAEAVPSTQTASAVYTHAERARVPEDNSASVAAIQFALTSEQGMDWLRLWNEGNFNACRKGWPDAPSECYIGADILAAAPSQPAEGIHPLSDDTPVPDYCKHGLWPCAACGTSHYEGCDCHVCRHD